MHLLQKIKSTFFSTDAQAVPEPASFATRSDTIYAPTSGVLVSIQEINDGVIASGLLGDGYGIIPVGNTIYAPADGRVDTVTVTNHAVGIMTKTGIEVLIHVGIDTVNMEGKGFVRKAFTIVFVATIIIWFLQTFDIRFNVVTDQSQSLLAGVGQVLAPIFAPLGFGDWRASTALAAGFAAKESVVSTLTVLLGGDVSALSTLFTPLTAFCFLTFTLLYTPCVAAVSTVRSELGTRMMWAVVGLQCGVAWIVSFAVHLIGMAVGLG